MDRKKARTSGREALSRSGTTPLKPKDGLNGAPGTRQLYALHNGDEWASRLESEWTARSANVPQAGFILQWNYPTQAKRWLEWGTRLRGASSYYNWFIGVWGNVNSCSHGSP